MNLHAPYRFKQPPTPEVVEFLVAAQRLGTIYKPLADNVYDLRRQLAETRKYLREDTALAASGKWTSTFSTADGFRFASERDRTALLRELARMSTQLDECDAAISELQVAARATGPALSTEALALLERMHALSEDLWAAGWHNDLESDLWSAAEQDGKRPEARGVPMEDAEALADLAARAGGWWVHCSRAGVDWSAGTVPGRVFMPLADWSAAYAGSRA